MRNGMAKAVPFFYVSPFLWAVKKQAREGLLQMKNHTQWFVYA